MKVKELKQIIKEELDEELGRHKGEVSLVLTADEVKAVIAALGNSNRGAKPAALYGVELQNLMNRLREVLRSQGF